MTGQNAPVVFRSRPAWVEVDLSALAHNARALVGFLRASGSPTRVCAIVKSDAYGHGLVSVAQVLCRIPGVSYLGVTAIEEAVALRERRITSPILLLGSIYPYENIRELLRWQVTPTVSSVDMLRRLQQAGRRAGRQTAFHLKVDTGMGRIGIQPAGVERFIHAYRAGAGAVCEGVYTHCASADGDAGYTRHQLAVFRRCVAELRAAGIRPRFVHAANSAALLRHPDSHGTMVRPGLLLYGLSPFPGAGRALSLRPVLSLKGRIVFIKTVPRGVTLSYGGTYRTTRRSRIATVPLGYADGLSRRLSNKGAALIRGVRCPIVGRVTMDMTLLDVTGVPGAAVGDEAVFIGTQGGEHISAGMVAGWCDTISYEVVVSLSSRLPRVECRP